MNDEDKLAKEIQDRIDYEQRLRNEEHIQRFTALMKEREEDIFRLGESHGVTGKYDRKREALDKEFQFKREIDADRYNRYWDSALDGTYKSAEFDAKQERKLENAESTVRGLVRVYGTDIPEKHINTIKEMYGDNVMEQLAIRQKQVQHEKALQQQKTAEQKPVKQQDKPKPSIDEAQELYLKLMEHEKQKQNMQQRQSMS